MLLYMLVLCRQEVLDIYVIIVQLLSPVWLRDPMDCSMPGSAILHYLLELAQIYVHWVGDSIQPSHPVLHPSPVVLNPSQHQRLFQGVSTSYQWSKYCRFSFSFSISPSNEYSGLISFRIDWLDLLEVQGTFRVFSSITIWIHQFFLLSLLYGSNLISVHEYWKNHSFDYMDLCQWCLGSLILSRFVIAFLPRRKCLLISGLQSLSTLILEPQK